MIWFEDKEKKRRELAGSGKHADDEKANGSHKQRKFRAWVLALPM